MDDNNGSGELHMYKANPGILPSAIGNIPPLDDQLTMAYEFSEILKSTIKNKVFCQLENGYFELVPNDTRKGDIIVAISSPYRALVLRGITKEPVTMVDGVDGNAGNGLIGRLIGTAYVHGIMDDKAFDDFKSGMHQEQAIYIV